MNCLSMYADDIQKMLTEYSEERGKIIHSMQAMKNHANFLKFK